jgi:hypothetical protein
MKLCGLCIDVMDSIHRVVDLFHRFSNRKLILENSRCLEFCKNTPELFQNYVLVPNNLHLGLCLNFYIHFLN